MFPSKFIELITMLALVHVSSIVLGSELGAGLGAVHGAELGAGHGQLPLCLLISPDVQGSEAWCKAPG